MDHISEIKNRLAIEDLVSQYVPLKKAGRQFKALCPFHKERTPSFYVSPERQLAYCFGCHKGGDHFKFIQDMEGLDFRGALEMLAERTGVTLPKMSFQTKEKKSEMERLHDIHEKAAAFFENGLQKTEEGEGARKYLKKRGLAAETIEHARLGYAPEKGDRLFTHLLEQNFTRAEILTAGLIIARDTEQGTCFDRFRNRLMFPIKNLAGEICGFASRALKEGDEPKYLNSPETPIYQKGNLLYGLFDSRTEIRQKKSVLLVEGNMDVLACRQAGYQHVAACSGTALTEAQLKLLKRFTNEIIFALDRDNAGKMATLRSLELALKTDFLLKVAVWESTDKDPDETLKNHPEAFEKAIGDPLPAQTYLLENFRESNDIKTTEGKKIFFQNLLPFLVNLASAIEIEDWLKRIAGIIGISLQSLYDELKRFQNKPGFSSKKTETPQIETTGFRTEEYLLGLILTYPETISKINLLITPEDFQNKELQNIYRSLGTQYNQNLEQASLSPEETERANILSLYVESRFTDMPWEAIEKEVMETVSKVKEIRMNNERRSLIERMKTAPEQEQKALLDSYQKLLNQAL